MKPCRFIRARRSLIRPQTPERCLSTRPPPTCLPTALRLPPDLTLRSRETYTDGLPTPLRRFWKSVWPRWREAPRRCFWLRERQRSPYTVEALASGGGHIVAQKTIYGGTYNLLSNTLPGLGISASFVNIHDLDETEAAVKDNTRALYIETMGNPGSDIPNIDAPCRPCSQTRHPPW